MSKPQNRLSRYAENEDRLTEALDNLEQDLPQNYHNKRNCVQTNLCTRKNPELRLYLW